MCVIAITFPLCRDSVPEDATTQLRDMVLDLTGRAVVAGQNKVILRKLFVAVRRILSAGLRTSLQSRVMTDNFSCNQTSSRTSLSLARLAACDHHHTLRHGRAPRALAGFPVYRRGRNGDRRSPTAEQVRFDFSNSSSQASSPSHLVPSEEPRCRRRLLARCP